jgi:hypothetical protein
VAHGMRGVGNNRLRYGRVLAAWRWAMTYWPIAYNPAYRPNRSGAGAAGVGLWVNHDHDLVDVTVHEDTQDGQDGHATAQTEAQR